MIKFFLGSLSVYVILAAAGVFSLLHHLLKIAIDTESLDKSLVYSQLYTYIALPC